MIVSSSQIENATFLKSVCMDTVMADEGTIFGRISMNQDLSLFLYGINDKNQIGDIHWHMFSRKVLGTIVLFKWGDQVSLAGTKKRIEYFTSEYNFPIVIAANSNGRNVKITDTVANYAIALTSKVKFIFYQNTDLTSMKNVLLTLINTVINLQP